MLFRSISTAAALLTAAGLIAPAHAHAAGLTASSSADALSAAFVVNGTSGKLAPQALASGKGPGKYSVPVNVASVKKSQAFNILTLSTTATDIADSASSAGLKAGKIASAANASIGPTVGTIATPLGTALTINLKKLVTSASLAKTATINKADGATTITGLSINSSVFGINKSYTGSPAADFKLYQSADKTVTVYLNRQIKKTTAGNVTSISVSAVNLHIVNFTYQGQTVSGDFYLATSSAN